jgi:hypothetical protein
MTVPYFTVGGISVVFRWRICVAACLMMLFLTSCSLKLGSAGNNYKNAATATYDSNQSSSSSISLNVDLNTEAASLSSTPGRVALALIICKMDSSRVLDELAKKDAPSLLNILKEIALQKSQTLESLDDQYDLKDILASEQIYVTIKSNDVSSVPAPSSAVSSSDNGWMQKFKTAINAS